VSANFITETAHPEAIKEFAGHIVGVPIIAGVPLVTTMLHEQKTGGFLSAALPSGLRAYSVKISPETGAGGFILPDDRVDVLLTRKDSGGTSADKITYSSETVLSNIRILAIDQSATDQTNRNDDAPVAIGKTATLALTQRQAEILALAEIQGGISLTLRSLADAHDEVVDQGEALAVRIHRPAETGVSVTRFTVSADTHKPTGVKIALH
jgi:pilus assembly protein CpaB